MAPLLLRTRMFRVCTAASSTTDQFRKHLSMGCRAMAMVWPLVRPALRRLGADCERSCKQHGAKRGKQPTKKKKIRPKRGGQTDPDLHRASPAEPPVDRHVPADLADAARDDARRARRGDWWRRPRAAATHPLPSRRV